MGSVRLTNLLGTFVSQADPTKNYDTSTVLYARNWSGKAIYSYLYFTRPFPLGATITSAKLHLIAGTKTPAGSVTAYLKRLKQAVTYSRITWNTRATQFYTTAEKAASKPGAYANGTDWTFDITSDMQAVADGNAWYGYQLRSTWATTNFTPIFGSPQHGSPAFRPWVEITWSDAPDEPTRLSPAGGRVVSTPEPILRFDYTDVAGDTELGACQVQISTSTSFTSPAYDSGVQPVDSPQWDLTGLYTVPSNSVRYWRVRVQDGAGLWSGWSQPASFLYKALPTLTIQNPAADPNNYVEEPTPPITWNVSGGTQVAYQLGLYQVNADGSLTSRWSLGRTTGNADGYTIPDGKITVKDATYRIDVRVYDAESREAVPNGLPYAQVSRDFTYEYSALTSPVTGLTAAPKDPRPGVTLNWERGTAPDTYSITRDGVVLASGLDPDNLWVSGTAYRWTDYTSVKGRSHVYSVQAVVNGKASASNPTVTTVNDSVGTWLLTRDGARQVFIAADKGREMEQLEQSEVYDILGSSKFVLITQALKGYSGKITGELHSGVITETSRQLAATLMAIKNVPGQTLLLHMQQNTLNVVVRNVQVFPKPSAEEIYLTSFEFYQQG